MITIYFNDEGIYRLSLAEKDGSVWGCPSGWEEGKLPWPELEEELVFFFQGKEIKGKYPLIMEGYSPWTMKILQLTREIPFGETCTYKFLAEKMEVPAGARAVGQALTRNRIPVLIPCHRVVGKSGALVGFGLGLKWKQELLRIEGHHGF